MSEHPKPHVDPIDQGAQARAHGHTVGQTLEVQLAQLVEREMILTRTAEGRARVRAYWRT